MNKKYLHIWDKENTVFFILTTLAIIVVYFSPFILNQVFFLIVVLLAYRSKKDYFWIAFLFFLLDAPGRLFVGGDISDVHRLAFYPLVSGVAFQFSEILLLAYLLKTLNLRIKNDFVFKNDFRFLIGYTILVLLYSFAFGMGLDSVVRTFRLLLPWSLVFILPKLIRNETDFDRINRLLFPLVFLALVSQMYSYLTGNYFGLFLKGSSFREDLLLLTADSSTAMRAGDSSVILIYCFAQALFYLYSKKQSFPRRYLYLVIFTSLFSVFLSATRGWILAYILILVMIFFTSSESKNIKNMISIIVTAIIIVSAFSYFFPLITVQIKNAGERLSTIADVARGDVTAHGTLARLDKRGPRVMKYVKKSPIVGWGFSNEYFNHADYHVGHHNMLLNVGILGFMILNIIYFKWVVKIYYFSATNWQGKKSDERHSIKILCFLLLANYVIHSTSAQSWGYDMGVNSITKVLLITLTLTFFSSIYQRSLNRQ